MEVENGSLESEFPFIQGIIFHWTMILGERVYWDVHGA